MTKSIEANLCKQTDCKVTKDGKCLEGLELSKCPHFYTDYVDIEDIRLTNKTLGSSIEVTASFNERASDQVNLFSGEDLKLEEISLITYKYNARKVFIIGESECGKTTLLATINDLLQLGRFNDLLFAGSVTMIGFERRSHYSRTKSNANKPETEKTKSSEFNFLHLALKRKSEARKKAYHLLISDISGERFRIASSSSSAMKELSVLKLADYLVFIVDGAQLINPIKRGLALFNTVSFIRKAIAENVFDENTVLKVVVSKCDLLDSSIDILEAVRQNVDQHFSQKLKVIDYYAIASRPEKQKDKYIFGYGLESMLNEWIAPSVYQKTVLIAPKSKRSFNCF